MKIYIPPSGGGGSARVLTPLNINLANARFDHVETIIDPLVTLSSIILVHPAPVTDFDDNDLAGIEMSYSVTPSAGSFELQLGFQVKHSGIIKLVYEVI